MGYSLTDVHLQILEYVHGRPEQEADYLDVGTHLSSDPVAQLEFLADSGLLRRALRGEGFYHLTPTGQTEVEAMLERRNDRGQRRARCREGLLEWLDNTTRADDAGTRKVLAKFPGGADGKPFTDEETTLAAKHLAERGLIKTFGTGHAGEPLMAYITGRGQEARDHRDGLGDHDAGIDPSRQADTSVTQNITIAGHGNLVVTTAGDHNHVTATLEEFDLDKARGQAEVIRQALPALEDIKDEIVPLLDQIHTDDRSLAQKATLALYKLLSGTGVGALGGALALPLAQALGLA